MPVDSRLSKSIKLKCGLKVSCAEFLKVAERKEYRNTAPMIRIKFVKVLRDSLNTFKSEDYGRFH